MERLGDGRHDGRLFVHENDHVVDEQRSFVDRCRGRNKSADSRRYRGQRARVERIVADLEHSFVYLARDKEEQPAVYRRRYRGNSGVPCALRDYQLFHTAEITVEGLAEAFYEGVGEVEYAYLFCEVLVDENIVVVVHLASVAAAPAHIQEILLSVYVVDNGRRNGKQYHYKRCKRTYGDKDRNKAYHRYDGADYREQRGDRGYWTHTRFAVGIFHLLIEIRHVEAFQIDLLCL